MSLTVLPIILVTTGRSFYAEKLLDTRMLDKAEVV